MWTITAQPIVMFASQGALKYVGFTIVSLVNGYAMNQTAYIDDMLAKWSLDKSQPVGAIDIEEPEQLTGQEDDPPLTEVQLAQKMAGGLLWASARTRGDIAFAVSRVASLSSSQPAWSLRLGKRVLRYLLGTRSHMLVYTPDSIGDVVGYGDSSFNVEWSQSGMAMFWHDMMLDWKSVKQPQVPRSTGEAEVTSLSLASLVLEGVVALLASIGIRSKARLLGDNTASISFTTGQTSWRTRTLSNKAAAIKQRIDAGELAMGHVPTQEMRADVLTKFWGVPLMARMRKMMGITRC